MAAQPLPEPQPKAVLRKERQTPVLRQLLFRPLNLESQHRLSFHPLSPPAFKGFTSQVRIHSPKTSMPRGLSYFFSPSISVLRRNVSSRSQLFQRRSFAATPKDIASSKRSAPSQISKRLILA